MLLLACSHLHAQEKLTLYYDKDGKGLDTKKKAVFYRIVNYNAEKKPVGFVEDYFPNGKLQFKCEAIYIDKLDNRKCVWKGPTIEYNEKGVVIRQNNYDEQGKLDGIQVQFDDDGKKTYEAELSHGNPAHDYYLIYDKHAEPIKYSYLNHQPMKLSTSDKVIVPTTALQTIYQDGQSVEYYFIDGISVAVRGSREDLYGDYYVLYITIENGTDQQFDFDPSTITAAYGKDKKVFDAEVLTYDYYIKKVNRKQKWSAAFNAFAESQAASQAGYSASATGGYAVGVNSNGNVGVATGQSATVSYSGANQYAANQNASNNIASYNNQQYSIKKSIAQGYLKLNTIMPNSRLIGFVNMKYEKANVALVNIPVNGKVYQFSFGIKN